MQKEQYRILIVVVVVGVVGYGYLRLTSLGEQITQLRTELASTIGVLQHTITEATTTLGDALLEEQRHVDSQVGGVQEQVGSITGTVTDLQKLSKTDPELLAKYSKVFFLSEHYAPLRLDEIPTAYKYVESKDLQVLPDVLPHVLHMMDQAKTDGVTLYIESAYRSFNTQEVLKERYRFTYGAGTANQFSADQGYSEHQLGTTVDFITTGTGGLLDGFDRTPAYSWLVAHAYQYGFVLSYPKNNVYYTFEPWHWRFVGVKLATTLHNTQSYFYLMDQRTIDTYLVSLFD